MKEIWKSLVLAYIYIYISLFPSLSLSISMYLCPSLCLSQSLPLSLSIYLFIYLSILTGWRLSAADPDPMHRSKWCNRKRSVGVTAHVIAPASKIVSHRRSFSHLFLFTILPVKRTQETRNIHSSALLSTSMATKGCGIQFYFLFLPAFTKLNP